MVLPIRLLHSFNECPFPPINYACLVHRRTGCRLKRNPSVLAAADFVGACYGIGAAFGSMDHWYGVANAVYHHESCPELAWRGMGSLQLGDHLPALYFLEELLQSTVKNNVIFIHLSRFYEVAGGINLYLPICNPINLATILRLSIHQPEGRRQRKEFAKKSKEWLNYIEG